MRKQRRNNRKTIIALAYLRRDIFSTILIFSFVVSEEHRFLCMGIAGLLMALYDFVGYICRWKHIYCSRQRSNNRKMTPDDIDWDNLTWFDAYGIPLIFTVFGIVLILVDIFI